MNREMLILRNPGAPFGLTAPVSETERMNRILAETEAINRQNKERTDRMMNTHLPPSPSFVDSFVPNPSGLPRPVRPYMAGLGRWLTAARLEQATGFRDETAYGYCFNNPVTYVDPSGDYPQSTAMTPPWETGIYPGMPQPNCNTWTGLPTGGVRPPLPPGQSYTANCCQARDQWPNVKWFWDQNALHGPWDYKWQGYDDGGNCNFGIAGNCMGIPLDVLLRAAGFYKSVVQHRPVGPIQVWPYGNDAQKQALIIRCYCDAQRNSQAFQQKCERKCPPPYQNWMGDGP